MKRLLLFLWLLLPTTAPAAWTPPAKPNAGAILHEATADARMGRFEDALAKQVWFHENALKYDAGQYGVRLSFALSDWVELGAAYPPALARLKSIRDQDEQSVREADGAASAYQPFIDLAAIDKTLDQESRTAALFDWLDMNKPPLAKKVFPPAESALIQAKEYQLCLKYTDAKAAYADLVKGYQQTKGMADNPQVGKQILDFANHNFSHGATTLVALLAINDRKAEADQIAADALKQWDNPEFKTGLAAAQNGTMPEPWP
jgi:hypothetical protein